MWVALVKAANLAGGKSEHDRMKNLVGKLNELDITAILSSKAMDCLLDLDPPLETVLTGPHEVLYPDETAQAISEIRKKRKTDPRAALLHLGEILRRVRNKREHGFKSRKGPRDQEILRATRSILAALCDLGIS